MFSFSESHCRVYISSLSFDDPNSDYINAVYVDGFRIKDQFIVTQFPLEPTIPDFWRLIAEKKIPLVVVLNDIDDGNKVCKFAVYYIHHVTLFLYDIQVNIMK